MMNTRPKKLLVIGKNAKTIKGDNTSDYLTAIMYLAPAKENSKRVNLCPKASKGCLASCLYTAGRGAFSNVQKGRIAKADYFVEDREGFLVQLNSELLKLDKYTKGKGKKLAVRLNGTSDIQWERYLDMSLYPDIQFYDYTKFKDRMLSPKIASNYQLTYSRAEDTTDIEVKECLDKRMNVSVVFSGKTLPSKYLGVKVFNGDTTDLRFLDPKANIIGLSAKGRGRKDTTGFVVHMETKS